MTPPSDFALLILSHGRADRVETIPLVRKSGYTGPIFIVIDDEDPTGDEYRRRFGDQVVMFDKKAIAATFDTGDLSQDRRTITYARNASWDIAEQLGLRYFALYDDDYIQLKFREVAGDGSEGKLSMTLMKSLDDVFVHMINFLDRTGALSVAFAQGGDFIGGKQNKLFGPASLRRKAMNTFICDTTRRFTWVSRINEDVCTYLHHGATGGLFFTYSGIQIEQRRTQLNPGGASDVYLNEGTYPKSFAPVMRFPSHVRVSLLGERLHHKIAWKHAVPCIISEQHRKPR